MANKFADGTFGEGVQWLHDILFDRMRLLNTNGIITTPLFKNTPNEQRNGVALTVADTNVQAKQVPVKQKWYLWALEAKFQGTAALTDANIQAMLDVFRNTLVQLEIINLDKMFTFPLSKFLPFDQLVSAPAVTVNSRYPSGPNASRWELKVPIVLEENALWGLNFIQTTASAAGLDNMFILFLFDREMYRGG